VNPEIDATHDLALESWVESANAQGTDFPLQNLPFGRFRARGTHGPWRHGVAIGDQILDLALAGLIAPDVPAPSSQHPAERRALRARLVEGLRRGSRCMSPWQAALVPQGAVELGLPCAIRGYTDFYAGIHHARAVGRLFRPDNPLLPNYQWVPIAYHGRASSIVASGHPIIRPRGQIKPAEASVPQLRPTARLDYELEMGIIIATGNALGEPIPIDRAEEHIAGLTLLNDWSARDVQAWEYQPLGPFLAKNFATTLSPWIVTLEALAPFRKPLTRPEGDPAPLPYLADAESSMSQVQVALEVWIQTERMRAVNQPGDRLSRSSSLDAYWSTAQLVTHHTVNGCNLESGDVLGTGTLSGRDAGQGGSLLELSEGGSKPVQLSNGEQRTFLEDGDRIRLVGYCERDGYRRIGFGPCVGTITGVAAQPRG
jgi:fumarylacetoacetase